MSKHLKEKPKKNKFATFLFYISLTLFIISAYFIINWIIDNRKAAQLTDNLFNDTTINEVSDSEKTELVNPPSDSDNDYWNFIKTPLLSVNFDELLKRNKDTVAWLNVNNTNINYPVVQSSDNSYYLNKAFDGSSNRAGWIFADYRNNMKSFDKNTVIYGHNRMNQIMFGSLKNVLNSNWYENKSNHIIRLSTPTENTMWQVFSVYKIKLESYYITTSFENDESYKTFIDTMLSRSIHKFQTSVSTNDKILTLSTCSNTADSGRIVVHSKLIKRESRGIQ